MFYALAFYVGAVLAAYPWASKQADDLPKSIQRGRFWGLAITMAVWPLLMFFWYFSAVFPAQPRNKDEFL